MAKSLAYYLEHPEEIQHLDETQVNAWVSAYPYSESLRILKARYDLDNGLESVRESIMNAAFYSSDLVFLRYQLLRDSRDMDESARQLKAYRSELATSAATAPQEAVVPSSSVPDTETETPIEPIASASSLTETVATQKEETVPTSTKEVTDSPAIPEEAEEASTVDELALGEDELKINKIKMVDDLLKEYQDGLSDFSEWLLNRETTVKPSEKVEKKPAKPTDKKQRSSKKKAKKKKKKKTKLDKLIEHSIVEREGVVSETYAEVLATQGYTQKAIELYERLQLKFPEKSAYFARKIEDLQKL